MCFAYLYIYIYICIYIHIYIALPFALSFICMHTYIIIVFETFESGYRHSAPLSPPYTSECISCLMIVSYITMIYLPNSRKLPLIQYQYSYPNNIFYVSFSLCSRTQSRITHCLQLSCLFSLLESGTVMTLTFLNNYRPLFFFFLVESLLIWVSLMFPHDSIPIMYFWQEYYIK